MDMDEVARLWLFKTARKNYWRVAHWCDLDDLIQDGYMHYMRVVRKYGNVKDRRHIMRLFMMTFTNHLNDLSVYRTRHPEVLASEIAAPDEQHEGLWERLLAEEEDLSSINLVLAQAPEPIRKVLAVFASQEGRRKLRSAYRIKNGHRETLNERLARLTGLDPALDFRKMFSDYLAA